MRLEAEANTARVRINPPDYDPEYRISTFPILASCVLLEKCHVPYAWVSQRVSTRARKSAFRCLMDFGTGKSAVSRSCLIIRSLEATWTDETIPLWTGLGLSLAFVLLLTCKLT